MDTTISTLKHTHAYTLIAQNMCASLIKAVYIVAVDHTHTYFGEINCIYSIKCIAKEDDTYKRGTHMKMHINILYI